MRKINYVIKRNGRVAPFNQDKVTNAIYMSAVACGGHDREMSKQLSGEIIEMLKTTEGEGWPTVEEVQDLVEKVLIENGHAQTSKAYILYRDERSRSRGGKKTTGNTSDPIPYKKIWQILNWSVENGVNTIAGLNNRIKGGSFPELVKEAEKFYQDDLKVAAEKIIARKDELRVIIVAGPSSSGKSTTTAKLEEHLKKENMELVTLTVDNYFYDLDMHPKDEFGDYDYETPQALDIGLINEHLAALVAGKEVQTPIYNFKTGYREKGSIPVQVKDNQLILIDCLHGLSTEMTAAIDNSLKFKLYIETLIQMKDNDGRYVRWTDLRLLRRMNRDKVHRNSNPRETLEHWHYVRRSEMRYIMPYIHSVDHIMNGALAYELAIMKNHLFANFQEFLKHYENKPERNDCMQRAKRVYDVLDSIADWKDESVVPDNSILREFIGGSAYGIH